MSIAYNQYGVFKGGYTGGGCGPYATLGTYNTGGGFNGIRPPVPVTSVSGYYVVPGYSAPGYQTLSHGTPSGCGGPYFNIGKAYGYGAANCNTQYMGSICQ